MAAAVKIFVNGTLVWSPVPGAPNAPVTIRALNVPRTPFYFGFALIELQAAQGEFYVTAAPDNSHDGVLTLYGPADDRRLTAEDRLPLGLLVNLMGEVEQPRPVRNRFLSLTFSDASGASRGSFQFQFTCQAVTQEALFRIKRGRLPELETEPGKAMGLTFDIETLQPAGNDVGYVLQPLTPPGVVFGHGLQQSANRYSTPKGPVVQADYLGVAAAQDSEVFLLTGTDTQGSEQTIPFISWIYDTPARGELRIVAAEPDPAGSDANAETITLANVSSRTFSVAQCTLEDEQPISLFGTRLNLPYGTPGRHVVASGRLNPGDKLVVKPSFTMNNDFDAVTLRNRRGRRLDSFAYLRRLPGMPAPATPLQRVVFRGTFSLTAAVISDSFGFGISLEDGDSVMIRPNPQSVIWAGEIFHPPTGPQGWFRPNGQPEQAPAGWVLPLPGAPVYALLMGNRDPQLLGGGRKDFVIDRESGASNGLKAGDRSIVLQRNDIGSGRLWNWGQYDVEVIVLRH